MIRAVLDTNTLVSAVINTPFSVSQEVYQNFINRKFVLIISPLILEELDEVIHRKSVTKFHKRPDKELQEVIKDLTNMSYLVPGVTKIEVVRDSDDNMIVAAAIEGKADYIISRDGDLLDLKSYRGIKIITPEEFMGILRLSK